MSLTVHPHISLSPGTFSIFIARSDILTEALMNLLSGHRGSVLYLCGNYPPVLTRLKESNDRIRVRRALTAYQVLSVCQEADEQLILYEHDRTLFDDTADLLRPVGQILRQKAEENSTIVLFSKRPDQWLNQLEPFSHRMVCIRELETQASRIQPGKRIISTQKILEF